MSQEMLNKGICESTYHSVMNMVVDTGTLRHTVLNMSPGEKKKKSQQLNVLQELFRSHVLDLFPLSYLLVFVSIYCCFDELVMEKKSLSLIVRKKARSYVLIFSIFYLLIYLSISYLSLLVRNTVLIKLYLSLSVIWRREDI